MPGFSLTRSVTDALRNELLKPTLRLALTKKWFENDHFLLRNGMENMFISRPFQTPLTLRYSVSREPYSSYDVFEMMAFWVSWKSAMSMMLR